MTPLVSVVIAVYNGEKYIQETLDSIINQTLTDWDCWIVDDGSTDNTCKIVEKYSSNDVRFRLLRTNGGNGPYVAANIGIDKCEGRYVARLDADDICLPSRLEEQVNALEKNTDKNICCTEYFNFSENGKLVEKRINFGLDVLRFYLIFKNPLLHSSMFFRRDWFVKIGKYPEKRLAQDYFIWCKAVLDDELLVIHKSLVKWRLHDKSLTKSENVLQATLAIDVNNEYLNRLLKLDIERDISILFFGTFRGIPTDNEHTVWKGLTLFFKIQKNHFKDCDLSSVDVSILYALLLVNVESHKLFFKSLRLIFNERFTLLFNPVLFKFYLKFFLKRLR